LRNEVSKYEDLAATIALSGIKENILMESWEYREGKTFQDVRAAIVKGRKKGNGKFEREMMEIGYCLERVLKPKK
jgi:hypothetical protein